MTGPVPKVRCPICQDSFDWTERDLYRWSRADKYVPLDLSRVQAPDKRADEMRTAYRKCPNPSGDTARAHYLPWLYTMYQPAVVVGLVGEHSAGKTHLLSAMVAQIMDGGLQPYGLAWEPLDHARHDEFTADFVYPLMAGEKVASTNPDQIEYVDALLVKGPTGQWPVVFFDIAGEDFRPGSRPARFMLGASALIFVVDPGRALGFNGDEVDQSGGHDVAFQAALSRIQGIRKPTRGYVDLPVAVVVSKSDRLRFQPPADVWMNARGTALGVDPEAVRAESRDVYALLHSHPGARPWLEPFSVFRRCTLHFASATGGEPVPQGDRYPRGVRPRRVLEPLVALFAMTGVIVGPRVSEVGI